jgi:colicin import membrane protein
MSLQQ